MNKWIGIGRLTQDPDIKHVESNGEQLTIATYTLAVNRKGKKDEADYIRCKAFGKTAEFIEHYFHKGNKILIEGEVRNNNYTDKDGKMVYGTQILVNQVEFGESKAASQATQPTKPSADDFNKVDASTEEELPFN